MAATELPEDKKALIEQVRRLKSLGLDRRTLVPISVPTDDGIKKPPSWFSWTDYRDGKREPLTEGEIEEIWSKPEVVRCAIALDDTCFLIDAEGEGIAVQEHILMRRMSKGLQEKIRKTRTTSTPHGIHKLVHLDPRAYPEGLSDIPAWIMKPIGTETHKKAKRRPGEHAPGSGEIRVLSQQKYVIEVGEGYGPIDSDHEIPIELDLEESKELVELYTTFKDESMAIRMMVDGEKKESITKYWNENSGLRHDIALGLAGTLWHTKVPENLAYDLVYYIAKVTSDEELDDRLRAVRDTYKNGKAGLEVAGKSKLLPALDGNDDIIARILQGFDSLGYKITRASVTFKGSNTAAKYYGSVDEFEGKEGGPNTSDGLGGARGSKSDIAIDVCTPFITNLFVDKFDVPFATVNIDGQLETLGIRRHKFKLWMRKAYYESQGEVLNQTALESAIGVFESKATYSKQKKLLALRISDGRTAISGTAESAASQQIVSNEPIRIYYDLTNSMNQVIEITAEDWTLKSSNQVPEMFYRLQGQQPQVMPTKEYPDNIFDQFMDLVNAVAKDVNGNELPDETKKMRMLLKCYIVALFVPNIGKVILLLYGEQGSAKTAFFELVKMLVDPSGALTLAFPRSMAEIVQQLSHNFITYYDNVSIIKDWLSDVLCRAATGTGFTKRQLYTDDDDVIYEFIRSVGISAIHLPGSKPDMLDRSLIEKFHFIHKNFRRKYKEDILPTFYQLRPKLLGYIFDILSQALKIKAQGEIQLETRSRMADWEEWGEIIARSMGYKPMEFINAYIENTKLQSDLVLEDRPVARAVVKLVESLKDNEEWAGMTTKLLQVLQGIAEADLNINTVNERLWPKSANALSYRLNEVKPTLRELGIEIYETFDRSKIKTLHIRHFSVEQEACKRPPASPSSPALDQTNKTRSDKTRSNTKDVINAGDEGGAGDVLHTSYSTEKDGIYACVYCEIIDQYEGLSNAIRFPTLTAYEKHIVEYHRRAHGKNLTFDPEPEDLKKFKRQLQIDRAHRVEREKKQRSKGGGDDTK